MRQEDAHQQAGQSFKMESFKIGFVGGGDGVLSNREETGQHL